MLSAETSNNHTLIPALLNLLQRRNSRGPPDAPAPGGPARLLSAREETAASRSLAPPRNLLHRATQCLGLLSMMRRCVHRSAYVTPLMIRPRLTESAKLRSIGVSLEAAREDHLGSGGKIAGSRPTLHHTSPFSRWRAFTSDTRFVCKWIFVGNEFVERAMRRSIDVSEIASTPRNVRARHGETQVAKSQPAGRLFYCSLTQ